MRILRVVPTSPTDPTDPAGPPPAGPRRSDLAGPPPAGTPVPAAVVALAGPAQLTPIWRNGLGGLTYRAGADRFVKWAPPGVDLVTEVRRLEWAGAYTAVPSVLEHGADADGSWLVTAALPGESAVDPRWRADPELAAAAIGRGLRALHDALPVADCPFDWSVATRLEQAGVEDFPPPPPIERLVVCHGDACVPNTLLLDDGTCGGHVDLGALGVADRWADLAIATWSTEWNYGPGFERTLLDAYGVEPDTGRSAYYRRLWDAT